MKLEEIEKNINFYQKRIGVIREWLKAHGTDENIPVPIISELEISVRRMESEELPYWEHLKEQEELWTAE